MKTYIATAFRLSGCCLVLFSVVYTLTVWCFARILPMHGEAERIEANGRRYYAGIGQPFTEDRYFWSRPSAVGYNAAGSGGSNLAAGNPVQQALVRARIDTFLVHHPGLEPAQIPAEMVTASGSGLDPDISVPAALVQVGRIARVRGLQAEQVRALIHRFTVPPALGFIGQARVNVLRLNLALDQSAF